MRGMKYCQVALEIPLVIEKIGICLILAVDSDTYYYNYQPGVIEIGYWRND